MISDETISIEIGMKQQAMFNNATASHTRLVTGRKAILVRRYIKRIGIQMLTYTHDKSLTEKEISVQTICNIKITSAFFNYHA